MSEKLKNCLNTNIPTTDDSQIECDGFIKSTCVIEEDQTQAEINASLIELTNDLRNQVLALKRILNTASNNNVVKLIEIETDVPSPHNHINSMTSFTVSQNEILIVKSPSTTWIFAKGKGVYGTGSSLTEATDFIQI